MVSNSESVVLNARPARCQWILRAVLLGSSEIEGKMSDQNRKTLRSFYCRDYLWELFEVMTRDLGCSMDYLINESMRHYARSRNYSLAAPRAEGQNTPAPAALRPAPAPSAQPQAPSPPLRRAPPPLPGGGAAPAVPAAEPQEAAGARPPLFLLFNGQRYRIDKEKFIIGRGSQQTDLTIRDGNISRKHCAVIYRGGQYFIKDLDSTNGIEFNGKRIEHKRVEEGDTFFLCDYELRFTYR
ncbi:MAG: FHA domain-containing protein [Myxococcales bacterium]|nr:FHA domain-containing protein [Myxococcales bacterium]